MRPTIIYSRYIPFAGFAAMTILWFVFVRKRLNPRTGVWENPKLSDNGMRHETIHVWQQVCILVASLAVTACLIAFGAMPVWYAPLAFVMPVAFYLLAWAVEVVLPPYESAYKDTCFEREAYANQTNKEFKFVPFSFLRYFLKGRK